MQEIGLMGENCEEFNFFNTALIASVYYGSFWENLVTSTFVPEECITKYTSKQFKL